MRIAKDDEIKCMANYADKTNLIENKDVFVAYIRFCNWKHGMEWQRHIHNATKSTWTRKSQRKRMRAKSNESESIIKSSATEIVFTESTKIARMQISKDVCCCCWCCFSFASFHPIRVFFLDDWAIFLGIFRSRRKHCNSIKLYIYRWNQSHRLPIQSVCITFCS